MAYHGIELNVRNLALFKSWLICKHRSEFYQWLLPASAAPPVCYTEVGYFLSLVDRGKSRSRDSLGVRVNVRTGSLRQNHGTEVLTQVKDQSLQLLPPAVIPSHTCELM